MHKEEIAEIYGTYERYANQSGEEPKLMREKQRS